MNKPGVIFKRYGCRDTNGRRLEQRCRRLADRGHGSWYFHACATNLLGRSEQLRRGGYPSQAAARRARDEWLASTGEDRTARSWTVERWLRYWLSTRTHLRPTSLLHYTRDVERVLIPWLGSLCLADLDARRLRATFAQTARTTNRRGQPQSAAAMQHLRNTLCAALNLAVREGVIDANPARHIEVTGYRRPHAQVWTDDRVHEWQATGHRPPVAVWTVEHLATFLTAVVGDSLFALWWLIGLRGCAAARPAGCAGARSTSTGACCSSAAAAPPPATRPSKARPRPPPAPAPSRRTSTPCRCASIAHQAGADLKTLQDLLGHSSIVITADTYTSVLPHAQRRCANATAKLVLAAARRTRDKIRTNAAKNRPSHHPATSAPAPAGPTSKIMELLSEEQPRSPVTPRWHPHATQRPHQRGHKGHPSALPAGGAPDDVARPKGLEPPTF